MGRHAPLGPVHAPRRAGELRHCGGLPQGVRDGRLLVERSGGDERGVRGIRRHRSAAVAQGAGHHHGAHRPVLQPHGSPLRRQVARPQARDRQCPCPCHRLCLDHGRPLRQGVCGRPDRGLRSVEGLYPGRGGRHAQDARMAGRRKPVSPRKTCGPSPGCGERKRRILPQEACPASAAPAAMPRATSGRAPWSVSWPCRDSASPASTWAARSKGPP